LEVLLDEGLSHVRDALVPNPLLIFTQCKTLHLSGRMMHDAKLKEKNTPYLYCDTEWELSIYTV